MNKQPNILFVFSDQQHFQAMGFLDSSFDTPNLDRFAGQSTVFANSFCTTPQCSPSRSSIMTGLYPAKTGVMGNMDAAGGNPLAMPTIGAALQACGYRTAYFGKWHLGKNPVATAGWDDDFGVTGPETTDDEEVTARALRYLDSTGDDERPFALFLSYNNPHHIYRFGSDTQTAPTRPIDLPASWEAKDLSTVPAVQLQFMTEDQGKVIHGRDADVWRRYREIYREKVSLYDAEVGKILDAIDRHDLADSTLVTITSDHGDMDTHQGLIYKGPFMYEQMMHVPLMIRTPDWRNRPAGMTSEDFHTVNVDLAVTLADFAGAELPTADGVSLKPLLTGTGRPTEREFVIGQYYSKQQWVNPIRMIRTTRHKLTLYRDGGRELYHLADDPDEIHNLAADPTASAQVAALEADLTRWMAEEGDPFANQSPTTREGVPLGAQA